MAQNRQHEVITRKPYQSLASYLDERLLSSHALRSTLSYNISYNIAVGFWQKPLIDNKKIVQSAKSIMGATENFISNSFILLSYLSSSSSNARPERLNSSPRLRESRYSHAKKQDRTALHAAIRFRTAHIVHRETANAVAKGT